MASFYDKLATTTTQRLPIVAKLEGVFDALDDSDLLSTLNGKVHRGCQGYPVAALWRSYLASYVLNIPTVASLTRALASNPAFATVCGIHPAAVPTEATYSRFVAKLARHQDQVQAVMDATVARLREALPDFGKVVAIDSTDVSAWSHPHGRGRNASDPDAHWSKKRANRGGDKWWFGYKVHFLADAKYELPIKVMVTPANVADSQTVKPLLEGQQPDVVLCDAGYDAGHVYETIHDVGAIPIIKLNLRGRKSEGRVAHRSNARQQALALREHPGVDRDSPQWSHLYSKRVSIERLIGRAKEFRRLTAFRQRGLWKMALHARLSTLTLAASAVALLDSAHSLRKVA